MKAPLTRIKTNYTRSLASRAASVVLATAALSSSSWSASYFVSPSGDDAAPGTLAQPFRTLGKAALVMGPGDIAYVRAGTYRETVRPAKSGTATAPIAFQSYSGESVTLDGAELLSGWTSLGGGLWRAAAPATLGQGNDQIFVNDEMSPEAHWPNSGNELMRGRYAKLASGSYVHNADDSSVVSLKDSTLTLPASAYVGALVRWWAGDNQSVAQTGTVTAAGTGTLSVKSHTRAFYSIVAGNDYALYGKKEFIDQPGEWAYDAASGTVTMMFAPGVDPNKLQVEMKRRQWAFDLSDRSYISLSGFKIVGTTVRTNKASSGIKMSGLKVRYPSHFLAMYSPWAQNWDTSGIWLQGSGNVLKDSSILYSAGNGVSVVGANSTVENCVIGAVNYAGGDAGAVRTNGSGHRVQRCTMFDSARGLLIHRDTSKSVFTQNEIFNAGLHSTDLGATYAYRTDGGGTEISKNVIHDIPGKLNNGIMLDNDCHNFAVHHNLIYNIDEAVKFNLPSSDHTFFNNTLVASGLAVASGFTGTLSNVRFVNNIFAGPMSNSYGSVQFNNNLPPTIDPKFVDPRKGDFKLQPGSPGQDASVDASAPISNLVRSLATEDLGAMEVIDMSTTGASLASAPPPTPTGLQAFVDSGVANLTWAPRKEASTYSVYRSTSEFGTYTLVASGVASTAYSDSGLANGTTYYYRISATNANGESPQCSKISCVPIATGTGTGLWATYYQDSGDGNYFTTKVLERNETGINFNTPNAVASGLKTDNASARWEGQVQAPVTGSYSFSTLSDDGVRVWVDGKLIIDNWTVHTAKTDRGAIDLVAGQKYDIKVEYFEKAGWATLKLMWSYPGMSAQVVPTSRLYAPLGDGVLGTYYNDPSNSSFFTNQALQRVDKGIQFDWAGGSPGASVQADNFTAVYSGKFWAQNTGTYMFTLQGDNGCRLYIDGKLVIDQWYWNTGTWKAAVALEGLKRHDIRLEYAERTGYAILKLGWLTPDANVTVPMPANVFFSK